MEFRILGPLEVVEDGHTVDVGAAKQRALLAVLLLNANRVVSRDELIEALWGERAPGTAQKALGVYVSQLRKALGRERIRTRAPGYELRLEPGELDTERFEELVSEGRLAEALRLWRGHPLADFAYEPFAQAEIARLEELRLACLEERIDRDLARARHAALVGELEALVRAHPLRERLRAQLMLALYRSGRQAEALEAYQAGRRLLADELGLEPGAALRELQRAILGQDPSLAGDEPRPTEQPPAEIVEKSQPAVPGVTREVRKTVTVLVCDVTSTDQGLDPESLRNMVARGLEDLMPLLERHGATVEHSIGGVVTAIFGVPAVHEDDALRAVRAAAEMGDRLDALRGELEARWGAWLQFRGGIATGGVVTGGDGGRPFATGAPVEAAFALHRSATPGEVLLDERTLRLVRDTVEADDVDGRTTLRSVRVAATGYESRFDSPMVGRARELRRLRDAFEQAVADRTCQLFTILGSPGVGKSRLVNEFIAGVTGEARVARGRCLPYGEGITYWPVVEAVRDAAGLAEAESSEESSAKLVSALDDEQDAELVARRLGEVLGLTDEASGAEEAFWAVRTFFEALAHRHSLVVVFDDIHWGEPTFLDLVDHIAEWSREAPLLLLCLARPELLDIRPGWAGGKLNVTTALLEPLSEAESQQLVDNLGATVGLDARDRSRIVDAAGGNPLFVEELLALVLEEGDAKASVEVPPTIQALLAARLDRLGDHERAVLAAAAVEGKVFHEGSVADLVGASAVDVHAQVQMLVRRELVRPDRSVFTGERGYQFRHLLIRDATYDSIPKEMRAVLHERHAGWLERTAGERALEFEEILGYHLEQAFRYRSELGPPDESAVALGRRAAERLGVAGRRAFGRADTPGAMNLVSRAVSLLPVDDPLRVDLIPSVRSMQGFEGDVT
jgi:DNA-binding SARP family transcriptional activator